MACVSLTPLVTEIPGFGAAIISLRACRGPGVQSLGVAVTSKVSISGCSMSVPCSVLACLQGRHNMEAALQACSSCLHRAFPAPMR